ncbi:SDR family oxidoreductase [Pseudomonas sp. RIT-PI-AD]|uniref:dTDP-4-dehydrorhamnose reductase family protein n=1 Tax=Pseudomonas sp. RIT-PI-AD TaxID=3035294 RepID=UPI0021D9DB58|nr:SDR family oxidoreductase [Pseudomonas sp. RIT-PI-AD]
MTKVLIVGASGMLGYTLLRRLGADTRYEVHGTLRGTGLPDGYACPAAVQLHGGIDATRPAHLQALIERLAPQAVINCVGLIKQLDEAKRPAAAIEINALFPHRLAEACSAVGARLIHISTDCVFDGTRGGYRETDLADADDLYGRSKRLGEVDYGGHLTLRTSLIGHEVSTRVSLVDWFLSTRGAVSGYAGVVFSGLPTVEVARVLADKVLPTPDLQGLYQLSVEPIDKDRLLRLLASVYGHRVEIQRVEQPRLDRSLDSTRLRQALDYSPPAWEDLVAAMHDDYLKAYAPARRTASEAP